MNVSEFAKERNIEPAAIHMYISRNKDMFEGHIKKIKGQRGNILDDEAYRILNDIYPLNKSIEVLEYDPEAEKKIREKDEQIQQLNDTINQLRKHYDILLAEKHALELKIASFSSQQKMLDAAEERITTYEQKLTSLYNMLDNEKNGKQNLLRENTEISTALTYEKERADKAEARATAAETEANSYVRTWFGFFRRK